MSGPPDDHDNSPDDPERTAEEQAILNEVAERKGEEFVEEHAEGILDQARLVGEIKDRSR